jgi:hypothetical protein
MSITAAQPATIPIPVQLSELEFEAFILPHLAVYLSPTDKYHRLTRRSSQ